MKTEKPDMRHYRVQVGIQFRVQREAQGWSVEQVATMADVKPATVEKIEAGAFNVPLDVLMRVAEAIGCVLNIKSKG